MTEDYTITSLEIDSQGLTELPYDLHLYTNLTHLSCCSNLLTSLDGVVFPATLTHLFCCENHLTSLDHLPSHIKYLWCGGNLLTSLDHLPSHLIALVCYNNLLNSLDHLPPTLTFLICNKNRLSSLDHLPSTLNCLFCDNNDLTSLENLPDTIMNPKRFGCAENPLHCNFERSHSSDLDNIREYNKKMYYKKVKPPVYKENLIQKVFHPRRVYYYLDQFNYNILTEEVF
jgi:hypothetical protein